jgi:hypothetical protein
MKNKYNLTVRWYSWSSLNYLMNNCSPGRWNTKSHAPSVSRLGYKTVATFTMRPWATLEIVKLLPRHTYHAVWLMREECGEIRSWEGQERADVKWHQRLNNLWEWDAMGILGEGAVRRAARFGWKSRLSWPRTAVGDPVRSSEPYRRNRSKSRSAEEGVVRLEKKCHHRS